MKESHAAHEKRTVGLVERHHEVVAFVGDRTPGNMLEGNDGFLDHTKQTVADD
jgi:hypothetical protein